MHVLHAFKKINLINYLYFYNKIFYLILKATMLLYGDTCQLL